MQPPYDAALRDAVRIRMSPPNRESVAQIARDTGITAQTIYNWRSQWQKQGQLVPASPKPPEQWSAADKLAAVIQAAGLSGTELGTFCRERGCTPSRLHVGARPLRMPMAPVHRAWLISGNCNERIMSKRVRSAACSVNWIRRKRHSQRRQRC